MSMEKTIRQLIYVPENPEKGFNFGYFLNIRTLDEGKLKFIVECNNTSVSNDMNETKAKTMRRIEENQEIATRLQNCVKNSVVLMPTFIRPNRETEKGNIYTHSLTSDALNTDREDIVRVDRQLLCMIDDAKEKLKNMGYSFEEKITLTGFSASAKFAQRFAFFYPELVEMVIAGGMGALPCLPVSEYKGIKLNYPLGTNDYKKYTNRAFNKEAFDRIPQYLFIGAEDKNDPVPYDDCYTSEERDEIYKVLGKDMQKERWPKMVEILKQLKQKNTTCVRFDGVEHSPRGMMEWVAENVLGMNQPKPKVKE